MLVTFIMRASHRMPIADCLQIQHKEMIDSVRMLAVDRFKQFSLRFVDVIVVVRWYRVTICSESKSSDFICAQSASRISNVVGCARH